MTSKHLKTSVSAFDFVTFFLPMIIFIKSLKASSHRLNVPLLIEVEPEEGIGGYAECRYTPVK